MGTLLFFSYALLVPFLFILYRKLEFASRARRAKKYGDCYVKKPVFTGILGRWVKRIPLDVTLYYDMHRKFGPTFATHPFTRPLIMTIDPENVQTVLAKKFGEFDIGEIRQDLGQRFMRKGVFTQQGGDWHNSRLFLRPAFNKATYATNFAYLERHFQSFLRMIPKDGQEFDIQPLFFGYSLNNICIMLFGVSIDDLGYSESERKSFSDAEATIRIKGLRAIHLSLLSRTLAKLYRSPQMEAAGRVFQKFVNDLLRKGLEHYAARAEKGPDQRYIFLHEIMDRKGDLSTFKDEASNVLFAGRDTSAVIMSIILWTLARNPRIWQHLQEEVADLHGELPTYEVLKNMKYLNNVLKETNRLFPVVPINYREALVDTTLPKGGGSDGESALFISKGSYVFYCTYAMHRETGIYGSDALEFKPERWENPSLRPGWGYVPFNGGPRTCIGQNLALTEMAYTVVRLVQIFKNIRSEDSRPFKPSTNFVMENVHGVRISLWRKD